MEVNSKRWEIHTEWVEKERKFVSATCSVCKEHVERMRKEALGGKTPRLCMCYRPEIVKGKLKPGDRFGRLVAVGRDTEYKSDKNVKWIVTCDCGVTKSIQGSQLRSGSTQSCGCLRDELNGRTPEKHGMSRTKEHKTWCGIVSRTQYECASTREWYFDKGIGMSPEWRESFIQFYADMGPCPEGYTIDRIDPAGDYSKENCRWASIELQSINKGIFKNNTSGSTGVSQTKTGSYVAYIYHNYGRIHLGTFKQIEDAINARKQAEETYWGEINE